MGRKFVIVEMVITAVLTRWRVVPVWVYWVIKVRGMVTAREVDTCISESDTSIYMYNKYDSGSHEFPFPFQS